MIHLKCGRYDGVNEGPLCLRFLNEPCAPRHPPRGQPVLIPIAPCRLDRDLSGVIWWRPFLSAFLRSRMDIISASALSSAGKILNANFPSGNGQEHAGTQILYPQAKFPICDSCGIFTVSIRKLPVRIIYRFLRCRGSDVWQGPRACPSAARLRSENVGGKGTRVGAYGTSPPANGLLMSGGGTLVREPT